MIAGSALLKSTEPNRSHRLSRVFFVTYAVAGSGPTNYERMPGAAGVVLLLLLLLYISLLYILFIVHLFLYIHHPLSFLSSSSRHPTSAHSVPPIRPSFPTVLTTGSHGTSSFTTYTAAVCASSHSWRPTRSVCQSRHLEASAIVYIVARPVHSSNSSKWKRNIQTLYIGYSDGEV